MTYVISREVMYDLDKKTMNNFGIPSRVLMEIAGQRMVDFLVSIEDKSTENILVVCGHGNNGGDGFVIARGLKNKGYYVNILFDGQIDKLSNESYINYELCQKLNIPITNFTSDNKKELINKSSVIVDAIFGIGFRGKLSTLYSSLIKELNDAKATRFACDIPSGLDADSGNAELAFKADYTCTMAAIKQGLILNKGIEFCGKIKVIDISIPQEYFQDKKNEVGVFKNKLELPKRFATSHKGDYGKVLIMAGSKSFTGAAILSSKACVKAGAGLVKLLHEKGIDQILENSLIEVMTDNYENQVRVDDFLQWSDVVLIGCGLGKREKAVEILKYILTNYCKKIVIDADGINIIAQENLFYLLAKSRAEILLTPHLGEFSRLVKRSLEDVRRDIISIARDFCKQYPYINLLVKSSVSFFMNNKELIYINKGNDGLSTGGSGDVLAGIITSFIAQGMNSKQAATNGSYYLGSIAEKLSESQQSFSIIPTEIINNIGKL